MKRNMRGRCARKDMRLLVKLVKDGNLTIQKAAAEADMTVTQFEKKYLK